MSRGASRQYQTLADLLCEPVVEVRCQGCGRASRHEVNALLDRLRQHDWAVPLHEAARSLRCRDCGARAAHIALPSPVPGQRRLRLVPADDEEA